MSSLSFFVALVNLVVVSTRFIYCIRAKRIISVVWFLIAYFAFFFLPVAALTSYTHFQGYTAQTLTIDSARIESTCYYILGFNLIFLVSEIILGRMASLRHLRQEVALPEKSRQLDRLSAIYLAFLLIGGSLYAIRTIGFDYRDYISAQGSNWSTVFLWAAAPFITLSAMRRQYTRALVACVPFMYFAFLLKVRSFALLSIIPLAIVYVLQVGGIRGFRRVRYFRVALLGGGLALAVLMSSAVIIAKKTGNDRVGLRLPDSGMPFGVGIMMELSDIYRVRTGWDALELYGRNIANPVIKVAQKVIGVELEQVVDPPYVMGQYFDGVPRNQPMRLHYPALWYADAYFAFGKSGLWLAVFWAFVLVGWELVMTRGSLILGLFLPYYSWHAYMLIRGAIAGASVPISYAFYISIIAAVIAFGFKGLTSVGAGSVR